MTGQRRHLHLLAQCAIKAALAVAVNAALGGRVSGCTAREPFPSTHRYQRRSRVWTSSKYRSSLRYDPTKIRTLPALVARVQQTVPHSRSACL